MFDAVAQIKLKLKLIYMHYKVILRMHLNFKCKFHCTTIYPIGPTKNLNFEFNLPYCANFSVFFKLGIKLYAIILAVIFKLFENDNVAIQNLRGKKSFLYRLCIVEACIQFYVFPLADGLFTHF